MKAAVLQGKRELEVLNLENPSPSPHEVLIKVKC